MKKVQIKKIIYESLIINLNATPELIYDYICSQIVVDEYFPPPDIIIHQIHNMKKKLIGETKSFETVIKEHSFSLGEMLFATVSAQSAM